MDNALVSTLLLVVLPLVIALGGYSLLRRRGSRSGIAGCGAVVLGLFVSVGIVGFMAFTAIK